MIKVNMLNISDKEHENCLNELMDLCNSFECYYIKDNKLIALYDNDELLDVYQYITDEFYFATDSDSLDIDDLESLSGYTSIV